MTPTPNITLLATLQARFEQNSQRHPEIAWVQVQSRLMTRPESIRSLALMEASGGEPDVVLFDGQLCFADCVAESPAARRSLCYDQEGLLSRKAHAPANSAVEVAAAMGITLMTEAQYRALQALGPIDQKSSSWLHTPTAIRQLGGALFGDYRYGTVFVYHNGAQSYYAGRGFRGVLWL